MAATVVKVVVTATCNAGRKAPRKKTYCIVCRHCYFHDDSHRHMHAMHHHQQLAIFLPREPCHHCQACNTPSMHLKTFAMHISTAQHRKNMALLLKKNVKTLKPQETLSDAFLSRIKTRTQEEKMERRKANKKKKKKAAKAENAGVTKNIENKKQPPEQTALNGGRLAARRQHRSQSASQRRQSIKESVSTMSEIDIINRNYDQSNSRSTGGNIIDTRPKNCQGMPQQPVGCNMHYDDSYCDLTADQLSDTGGIIFGQKVKVFEQKEESSNRSAQPGQERVQNLSATTSTCLDGPTDNGQLRDVDVSSILRQVRRELGVREPCRAERAARNQKQSQEAGFKEELKSAAQQTGLEKPDTERTTQSFTTFTKTAHNKLTKPQSLQCPQVDTTIIPVPRIGMRSSKVSAVKLKKTTQSQQSEVTSESRCDSDGPSSNWERGSSRGPSVPILDTLAASLTRQSTSAEPNLDAARRIRHVSESHKTEPEKEGRLRPTVQKLLGSSGKVDWNEMYQEVSRKKKEKIKGMPRFGIEMARPHSDQGDVKQDQDMALSEGFQWDSVLSSDPPPAPCALPSSPQNTAVNDSIIERPSHPLMQEHLEEPNAALGGGRSIQAMMTKDRIKVEPEGNNVPSGRNLNAENIMKRKKDGDNMGFATMEQSGKKRRVTSNEDHSKVDQLLMVSLKEDKLCQSLQEIDNSLILARNALQVAYTEVQRLLLLKQQCTNEVNTLRTQRIEILQGMQDGYTDVGTSDVGENNGSTLARAATVSPRPPPRPLSNPTTTSALHTPPSRASPSSITLTQPTFVTLPRVIKVERCEPWADEPARQHCNRASPHMASSPVPNSSVPVLLPSLLLPLSHTPAAPPAVAQQTEFITGRTQDEPVSVHDTRGGNDSDGSLEFLDPFSDVIDIEDSDDEVSKPSVAPQRAASVQLSAAAGQTQTRKFKEENLVRKIEVPSVSVNNPESADMALEEEPALGIFKNHTGPVYGMQVHGGLLYTCSGDNTVHAYSLVTKDCVMVFEGHTNKVNCLLVSSLPSLPVRLYTGSSDKTVCCYSIKSKKCLEQKSLPDRVLCLHIAWKILFVGVADGSVFSFDVKTLKQLDVFECHGTRGVSCMSTAQEGARRILLAGSYDSTISVRDAKSGLILRTLTGHTKTVLCLKVVNDLVFSGSSDTSVHAHNVHTGELVRIYKGHSHAVTAIAILGKVMVTASLDRFVRVHELQSHDRLQVYGGHNDMVMCMTIYKSTIYTGCYDGSVQAVRLNLMKNFRCWWHGCTFIFGIAEHLLQHLLRDHSNSQLQSVKCRWRDCNTLFSTQDSVKQDLPHHMQYHVEHNSKLEI